MLKVELFYWAMGVSCCSPVGLGRCRGVGIWASICRGCYLTVYCSCPGNLPPTKKKMPMFVGLPGGHERCWNWLIHIFDINGNLVVYKDLFSFTTHCWIVLRFFYKLKNVAKSSQGSSLFFQWKPRRWWKLTKVWSSSNASNSIIAPTLRWLDPVFF